MHENKGCKFDIFKIGTLSAVDSMLFVIDGRYFSIKSSKSFNHWNKSLLKRKEAY